MRSRRRDTDPPPARDPDDADDAEGADPSDAATDDSRTAWQVELNDDLTITTDGTLCHIGSTVSVTFVIAEVEFVWSEVPTTAIEPVGFLNLRMKDRPGTLASIRLKRHEAMQVRTLLEGSALPMQ